jgi:hypothetical protein
VRNGTSISTAEVAGYPSTRRRTLFMPTASTH